MFLTKQAKPFAGKGDSAIDSNEYPLLFLAPEFPWE